MCPCGYAYFCMWVLPGQGKTVAGREWETEAKVRAEDDLELNVLPQLPAFGASFVQYKADVCMGWAGRKKRYSAHCAFLLHRSPHGILSPVLWGSYCYLWFTEEESAVQRGKETCLSHPGSKGQSLDLNSELSDSNDRFFLCHVFMGCPLSRT